MENGNSNYLQSVYKTGKMCASKNVAGRMMLCEQVSMQASDQLILDVIFF